MSFESAVNRKAIDIGKLSVEMTTAAGSGHPSTALSLTHLVTVLMYHQMRWDPKNPWNLASDRLVLSEGHAVPIVYAAYADIGGVIGRNKAEARPMTKEDALKLRAIESPVDGHPNPALGIYFFDAATGSLGQGRVVLFGSHPEFGFTLGMGDEQEPARMLFNAVEWQIEESGLDGRPASLERPHVFTDRGAGS